ncbi:MAG: crossover junction endodeoxyribonuclease RuvC [Elusimicrobia bacterium]|nr:crossover junction endodeoxyribonuclease RuvC [Elusimicrobiota bacterium]
MTILGVDPGIADTGWALVRGGPERPVLLASGILKTSPRSELPERLKKLHAGLSRVLRLRKPEQLAVEEMFFLKAAHTVRATLQARGVILLAAAQAGVRVREYNPRQVKVSLTGSGSADKPQMQRMIRSALGLREVLRPDDVADAAAIALCHLRCSRIKSLKVLDRIGGRV